MKSFLFTWMDPNDCDPPHAITHDATYAHLIKAFLQAEGGWDPDEPALIGYPCDGRIQLLSGSHRWAAAKEAGITIPVLVRQRSVIQASWGELLEWEKVMKPQKARDAE